MRRLDLAAAGLGLMLAGMGLGADGPKGATWPGMTKAGAVLLPNGWSLRPAGAQSPLGDFPVALAENPAGPVLAALHAGYGEHEVVMLDASTHKVLGRVTIPHTFAGLVWSPDGRRLYVGGGFDDVIYAFDHAEGLLSGKKTFSYPDHAAFLAEPNPGFGGGVRPSQRVPAGLAVSADGGSLWVAAAFGHSLARFDTATGKMSVEIKLDKGTYPYALAWDEPRGKLYASLWGAASVAVVDATKAEVVGRWATEEHPTELLLARAGKVLYAANANRNTVSVFDAEAGKPVETIGTAIVPNAPSGSTPCSLALSADESVLFVANANTNDVAAVNVKDLGGSTPLGFIPVGWYPTCVRVSKDGKTLLVANGKGSTSAANRDGPNPLVRGNNSTRQYIGGLLKGTLSAIPMPTPRQMAAHSEAVYACSPIKTPAAVAAGGAIPAKVGDPSPITHCIYIIKENRTYDQVFGDMPEGNGEKALCLFPDAVTPNHHALAREFVLLDNFYVDAEVSADGHEWSTGAYATDFVEKTWPLSYRGDRRVPYPSEGAQAIARPAGGYLWDAAARKGVTYRSYGEFIENARVVGEPSSTKVEALKGHFDPLYRGYDLNVPDARRADRFLEELAGFEKAGEMPRLIILRLPNDHTSGTALNRPTPTAYLADNDLALGRVVEGLSRSKFWPHLAIFVVEDDAQNGSDHVDAHRTVALAISPYIKKKSVDSSMYSTSSMLRTIELCLGLDPMSQFDAAARPMSAAFGPTPDLAAYVARPAGVDLKAVNLATAWGAAKSLELDLEVEDRADDLVFNEIIWKSVKGSGSAMPPPVRAAFVVPRARVKGKD